jgi:hypothetical protein
VEAADDTRNGIPEAVEIDVSQLHIPTCFQESFNIATNSCWKPFFDGISGPLNPLNKLIELQNTHIFQ